jgi:four helix bundle protein
VTDSKYRLDDFELYQRARQFRRDVYKLIRQLPPEEKFCLDPQMRRAAVSVSNNIAEGHGRWYYQENIRFCSISRGSVAEILDDLNVCEDENYGNIQLINQLRTNAYELIRRINGYCAYLRNTKQGAQEQPWKQEKKD